MADENNWVTTVITDARRQFTKVPEPMWTRFATILNGRFSERPLPANELGKLAEQLIQEVISRAADSRNTN